MRNYFVFDGVASKDYGVWISGNGTFSTPARKYSETQIDGRNGALMDDHGTFSNVEIVYPAYIYMNFNEKYDGLRAWLSSTSGYKRLEDTYHPDVYRMACFANGLDPSIIDDLCGGTMEIRFNCMPQRFLKSGEHPIEFGKSGIIFNPTRFRSKPMIRVYGTGAITIGGVTITVNTVDSYIDIDCERMDCYKGSLNCNGNITLQNGKFPEIPEGTSDIVLDGIEQASIIPRWFTI